MYTNSKSVNISLPLAFNKTLAITFKSNLCNSASNAGISLKLRIIIYCFSFKKVIYNFLFPLLLFLSSLKHPQIKNPLKN